jgi:hypothetical protein
MIATRLCRVLLTYVNIKTSLFFVDAVAKHFPIRIPVNINRHTIVDTAFAATGTAGSATGKCYQSDVAGIC